MTDENIVENETNPFIATNGGVEHSQPTGPLPPLKMLLETSSNSSIERHIHQILRQHFLEQRSITWKPIKVELVVNTDLTEDFFRIRKKFEKSSNGNRTEFEEHYAFLIENDAQISDICHDGYHCTETSFNVLGHSKGGVYICKYADVCIRQASVRRTLEGNMTMKMILFKIVEGKQTAALVRKGPKLQPIAPTPLFTSHCSVITPKETDDLDKQFDQSQIFLYEFEGRETVKRPHHCLPYAVVSLIHDGSLWPTNFDDSDIEPDIFETDVLRVIAQTDDPLLQNKLKENVDLAEAATRALEHVYEEEPPPPAPSPVVERPPSSSSNPEAIPAATSFDHVTIPIVNGTGIPSSPTTWNDNISTTSPVSTTASTNNIDGSLNSIVPPPPPPPSSSTSSTATTIPTAKTPTTSVVTTASFGHSAAAVQAALRQHTGLLGALPTAGLRGVQGAVYATTGGFANGLTGQILYGGVPMDALRTYQTTTAAAAPYVFATHAGQTIQQPALYAAQLQAAAQQQAVQLAAAQQQQQQQQSLMNGIPAGCMLVRTANGGYAILAQSSTAAAMQSQAQASLSQQQYISFNAAGQPTATTARLPMAMVGGQPQQVVYQYGGQPTIQAAPTQYIQLSNAYAQQQQQQQLSTSPVMQTSTSAASQAYTGHTPTQYIGASQLAHSNNLNGSSSNSSSIAPSSNVVTSPSTIQSQPTATLISPQKQSAASATAAALQQQQQYQHSQYSQQQQQQQSQQQSINGTHGANVYYAAIAQAQAQLTAQVQAQQQAAAAAAFSQQQQFSYMPQMQYATQQGVPQGMYYTTPGGQTIYQAGGQSYLLAQAAPTAGTTTTGAPMMYSAGPALHNGAGQQQNQQHSSQSQQQIAYQIAAAGGQPATAAYQLLNAASNANVASQAQAAANAGVVAQQPAQLVQRPTVMSQVRHHPYRN